ncbi:MAG: tRNA (cytidine(34)-2'-O)-methyltransferase [Parachlamydiales bacterium]|jgi:tRNA (cytidine/uridine-2'-O-)-methyltransferase
MKIILFQPDIPQNTGNIIRTCSLTNTDLILVKPLGFSINEKNLKRAGLDYFNKTKIEQIDDLESYLSGKKSFYFLSSKAKKLYSDVKFEINSILIFGSETSGLPEIYHEKYPDNFITIPMIENARCLNLSNSVAIVLYEALRQNSFSNLKIKNND